MAVAVGNDVAVAVAVALHVAVAVIMAVTVAVGFIGFVVPILTRREICHVTGEGCGQVIEGGTLEEGVIS